DHPPTETAGKVADLGPGPRDGPTRSLQCRDRDDRLLLRSEIAVAARQQRKHQWAAAPVPATPAEFPRAHPRRLRRHRRRTQRPASTNPRLQDTIRSTSRSVALTA